MVYSTGYLPSSKTDRKSHNVKQNIAERVQIFQFFLPQLLVNKTSIPVSSCEVRSTHCQIAERAARTAILWGVDLKNPIRTRVLCGSASGIPGADVDRSAFFGLRRPLPNALPTMGKRLGCGTTMKAMLILCLYQFFQATPVFASGNNHDVHMVPFAELSQDGLWSKLLTLVKDHPKALDRSAVEDNFGIQFVPARSGDDGRDIRDFSTTVSMKKIPGTTGIFLHQDSTYSRFAMEFKEPDDGEHCMDLDRSIVDLKQEGWIVVRQFSMPLGMRVFMQRPADSTGEARSQPVPESKGTSSEIVLGTALRHQRCLTTFSETLAH